MATNYHGELSIFWLVYDPNITPLASFLFPQCLPPLSQFLTRSTVYYRYYVVCSGRLDIIPSVTTARKRRFLWPGSILTILRTCFPRTTLSGAGGATCLIFCASTGVNGLSPGIGPLNPAWGWCSSSTSSEDGTIRILRRNIHDISQGLGDVEEVVLMNNSSPPLFKFNSSIV